MNPPPFVPFQLLALLLLLIETTNLFFTKNIDMPKSDKPVTSEKGLLNVKKYLADKKEIL